MSQSAPRIVIVGAGIAGVAAAYHLAVKQGCENVVLVEAENPLSMTSDKSTEGYRNWWPGPDTAMTAYMNHSIDLLQEIARASANRINMNRRGYVFASADTGKAQWLHDMATVAEQRGAGRVRVHDSEAGTYDPAPDAAYNAPLDGADIVTDAALIRRHFPYLNPTTRVVAHVRRAGWLSAQQLGMVMLEAAREAGVRLLRGHVGNIDTRGGRVRGVHVDRPEGRETLEATHVVLAAGPLLKTIADRIGLDLPIFAERHYKISLPDTEGAVPRTAPMVIWLDEQRLPWSDEEREALAADASTRRLTETFPSGVHVRPDGGGASRTLLMLFNYENHATDVIFPLPDPGHYAEITLRGMATLVPAMQTYVEKGVRPWVDGGYYMKTRENRPLIGPTPIEGLFLSGAYSGFGIMASQAGGDLLARHVLGLELPRWAPAFMLSRYRDPAYVALLDTWGDGGQL
jgi:glycine/D-amino acid oxidase-like deaminating enzyme